jgi:SAM-dependent methyltransferase
LLSMMADRAERATSFGTVAQAYDRYRPPPPVAAADWLLPPVLGRVADVCAGTGGFSGVLAGRVDEVVAVELDLRMAGLIGARSRRSLVVNGNGEALPLRSSSLEAVLVSSAWHWLDPDLAVPEIGRVLRPGGVLGVVWSGPRRRVDWVSQLLGRDPTKPSTGRGPRRELRIPPGQPFTEPQVRVIEWSLPRTPAELVGLAGTYSRVITLPRSEREAAVHRAEELIERHPLLRGRSEIDLPMTARCWRAVRLANPVAA